MTADAASLGLPDGVTACLFDLDGVLTNTAAVHAKAWKRVFDGFLRQRDGDDFIPFDIVHDYERYVDGKPREDGVRDFLASRGITLPDGGPDDGPDDGHDVGSGAATVHSLGDRKNGEVNRRIEEDGVEVFPGSVRYLEAARRTRLRRIVVSSSANTRLVLRVTGLESYIEGIVDGNTLTEKHLRGKPAPDSFLAGAELAGVAPRQAAVFEDALAGVAAGHAGAFGFVVGVDRVGQAAELKRHGADIVVRDLADLLEAAQ